MSPVYAPPAHCPSTGKVSFDTETDAQRGLHRVRKDRKGKGLRECAFYRCRSCGKYHLTSQRQRERR